jgi:MerR family redox-sensitive transcriptional activator SoxR
MLIGQVAQHTGLRRSAIRYYEERGLLERPPRVAGRRCYGPDALRRLAVIAAGQGAGLSLGEIRELLDADEQGRVSQQLQELARRKLPEIDALVERAQLVRTWLEAAAQCRCPSLDSCPLFPAEQSLSASA